MYTSKPKTYLKKLYYNTHTYLYISYINMTDEINRSNLTWSWVCRNLDVLCIYKLYIPLNCELYRIVVVFQFPTEKETKDRSPYLGSLSVNTSQSLTCINIKQVPHLLSLQFNRSGLGLRIFMMNSIMDYANDAGSGTTI